jgi:hypothetical protein
MARRDEAANEAEGEGMTVNWCVAVAVSGAGNLYLAAAEARRTGYGVCVPETYKRKRHSDHSSDRVWEPLLQPYFFVRFNLHDEAEERLLRDLRGVETILTSWAGQAARSVPKAIDAAVIEDHEHRMLVEKRDATHNWRKSRVDLNLGKAHRIVRHATFAGQEGILVNIARGVAHLRVGGWLIELPDGDIAPVSAKRAA